MHLLDLKICLQTLVRGLFTVFSKSGCLRLCIVWLLIYYVMIEMKNLYEIPWLVDDYPTWVMGIK